MNIDLTPVQRQWNLESEASRLGAERLRSKTREMEEREYSSGTLWGKKLVAQQVLAVAERIKETKKRLTQGKAQQGAVHLWDLLNTIEPETMAAIASKRTLDLIGMGKDNKGKHQNTYTKVCTTIGRALESEARFNWYEQVAHKEWKTVKALYFKPTTGTRQKEIISKTMMKRRGYVWERWSESRVLTIGGFMLDCIASTVKWFEHKKTDNRGKSSLHLVEISPELKNLKDHITIIAELQAPLAWPMVCEPAPWSNSNRGGYLTNELRQGFSLVRGQRGAPTLGEQPLTMLNTLQSVAYRVNPVTYGLMKALQNRQIDLGSFVMRDNEQPIPRPETEDEDVLLNWRRARTEQENRNAALKGKRYRTLETLHTADRFHAEERMYIPWSFDYRGRVYPLVSFMSPQGTGMEKSLYLFADAQPINATTHRWLAIHLANCAGKDKLPLNERVQWAKDNEQLISRVAEDPIRSLTIIEGTDDPWGFVAACHEYHHIFIAKDQTETSLPVATDATCSGLQHLSAMTLDGATASLVNVRPGDKPQDAYMEVLNETLRLLQDPSPELLRWLIEVNAKREQKGEHPLILPSPALAQWGKDVGRKLAKRVVMTVPYAATPHSNRGYIREAILDYEHDREDRIQKEIGNLLKQEDKRRPSGADLTVFTKVMLVAMENVVPGPIKVMRWIKQQMADRYAPGEDGLSTEDDLKWETPSGFPVTQRKRHLNIIRVKTQLLGEIVQNRVADGDKTSNRNKHMNCAAPNFIHSMDAALLHLSFAGFDRPFTLIHDSILTTASDMEYMAQVIREQFEAIYSPNDEGNIPLVEYARVLGVTTPTHLILDTFRIDEVNESDYFFS